MSTQSLDPELLEILACPETKQPVQMATAQVLQTLNDRVSAGTLTNRAGTTVAEPFDGGLVREDGKCLYPVRDGIPVMLIDEAIDLS